MRNESDKKTSSSAEKDSPPKKPFAKKSFGQNFLVDKNYIDKIIRALNPHAGEIIVEIGAGRGALTERLIESGAQVFAVELDRDLIPILKEKFASADNFHLIESDALKVDFAEIVKGQKTKEEGQRAKLVANLPYYISTAILQRLIEQREAFGEMILMFQREVVQRITAKPGGKERGFLTVLTEAFLKTEKLFDVPPQAFRPAPKVWSAVARLITKESENSIRDESLFREIASAGFQQKRKTIFNNLKNAPPPLSGILTQKGGVSRILEKAGIEPRRRAESLTAAEWVKLTNAAD